jgi:2-dehydropantoate 2-reductase
VGGAAHVDAITRDGLVLEGLEPATHCIPARKTVDAIEPGTLILLTAKVSSSEAAMAPLVPLLPDEATILCVQNGLYSEEVVRRLVGGRAPVLRAITQFGGVLLSPGVVKYTVEGYTLIENHERAGWIADLLTAAGLQGRITPDMKREVWRKAIYNCVINPVTSLVQCDVAGITHPALAPIKRQIIDECVAVARADGVAFDEDFMRVIDEVFGRSHTIVSMRQDLDKGRKTEIDFMNGAVADLGDRYGVACPVNRALASMIRYREGRQ